MTAAAGPQHRAVAVGRWSSAIAAALFAHAGAGWFAFHCHAARPVQSEPPPAVMVELAPAPAAPTAPRVEPPRALSRPNRSRRHRPNPRRRPILEPNHRPKRN